HAVEDASGDLGRGGQGNVAYSVPDPCRHVTGCGEGRVLHIDQRTQARHITSGVCESCRIDGHTTAAPRSNAFLQQPESRDIAKETDAPAYAQLIREIALARPIG